jgi:type IV secretory pathway VirB10-like protein
MNEPKSNDRKEEELADQDNVRSEDRVPEPGGAGPESMRAAIRRFFAGMSRDGRPVVQRDPKQDRTRPLLLLIGGIVGSVLLFVGVFSTPPSKRSPIERDRIEPNLGNRGNAAVDQAPSATPLLNAEIQSDEAGRDRLSATDIQNTSARELVRDVPSAEPEALALTAGSRDRTGRVPRPIMTTAEEAEAQSLERRPETAEVGGGFVFGAPRNTSVGVPGNAVPAMKSSIVYVRTALATGAGNLPRQAELVRSSLLPPGSRLIARLESAVSSALQTPVVASVEYNYEKNGVILVPAGTRLIGQLQQALANGLVGISFHSLQLPDGRTEQIQAVAMDLKSEPLKGNVAGTNKGRRLLTRTLSGLGTIAAYAVGGSGGLGQPVTGGTLLRDRIAGNVATAGDQELTNAALAQNVVVTVPAQTRIYVVFQKPAIAVETAADSPSAAGIPNLGMPMPTVQEIRELMDLRREINKMYRDSSASPLSSAP